MYANLIELHPTYQLDQHSIRLIWKDAASANKGVCPPSFKKELQQKKRWGVCTTSFISCGSTSAQGQRCWDSNGILEKSTINPLWRNAVFCGWTMAPTFGRYWYWRPLGSLLSKSPTWWKLSSPEWKQVGFFGLTDQTKILERPRWPVSPRMVAIIQVATAFRSCPEA